MVSRRRVIAGLMVGAASSNEIAHAAVGTCFPPPQAPAADGIVPIEHWGGRIGGKIPVFSSRSMVEATAIPADVENIFVNGYARNKDGGAAHYRRASAQPPRKGALRSADGAHWEVDEIVLCPEMFGALGNGSDELAEMDAFMDALGNGVSGEIRGTHHLSAWASLAGKSNFRLFGRGTLRLMDGAPTVSGHGAILVKECSNFEITGITLDGNRANRDPQERSAHLLLLRSCTDFAIRDVTARNGTCDGIHLDSATPAEAITHCTNFVLENLRCENNYRVGLSVIQARHFAIRGGSFSSSRGTMPQAGIDLESDPENPAGSIQHGSIENVLFRDNIGYGLQISPRAAPRNISVRNCAFVHNVRGALYCGMQDGEVVDCLFEDSPDGLQDAVVFVPGAPHVASINIVRPRFREMRYSEAGKPLVHIAAGGGGFIGIDGLDVDFCMAAATIDADDCSLENSRIAAQATDAGIHATRARFRLSRNRISGFRERAALVEGDEARIFDNEFLDPVSNSRSGVLMVTGANSRIDGNTITRTASKIGYGMVVDASFRSMQDNVVDGFRGNPFLLKGPAATEALGFLRRNIQNGARVPEN